MFFLGNLTIYNCGKKILLQKIKKGDLKYFESMFRENYSQLCNYANKFVGDMDQSEEIVQNLFCKIWEKKESLTIKTSLKSY